MKPYNRNNLSLAKIMRKGMTPWERKLWYLFLKGYTPRFQRQKPLENYIADFYCAHAQLVVELDGNGHYQGDSVQRDAARTERLEAMGIQVLRFCNTDVDDRFEGVCYAIDQAVKERVQAITLKKRQEKNEKCMPF